jgi:membrane protein DedA with SNARE-associated domain
MDLINSLLPKIEHFQFLGYWVVLLISLLESLAFVGIVVPGSTFIVFVGALTARGYWDLADMIWFAAVGAILGDGISFLLGKKGKFLFTEDNRIFKASYLAKGEIFFKKHGVKSVFLGRFIGPIRPVIPFIAGLSEWRRGNSILEYPERYYLGKLKPASRLLFRACMESC